MLQIKLSVKKNNSELNNKLIGNMSPDENVNINTYIAILNDQPCILSYIVAI